jgi:short-subunit dehydrogenase
MLVIGATGGLGRALADQLAAVGFTLILVARDERDLCVQATDLEIRHHVEVHTIICNMEPGQDWITGLREELEKVGAIDGVFLPVGLSSDDDAGILSEEALRRLIEVNFTGVVSIVNELLTQFFERDLGYIVGFGSVASVRGRGSNVVYSAAKRGLASYFESLRHLFADTGVKVHFYQLGYLRSRQTFGRRLRFPICAPELLAKYVIANLSADRGTVLYPRFWAIIVSIVRWAPWFIYKRLHF